MKNNLFKPFWLSMYLFMALALSAQSAIVQQAYLKASNTGANDEFGLNAVAISGDTIVVGAHWEDSAATGVNGNQSNNGAADSGAAYVFVRDGTNWTQQAYLKAHNTDAGDSFGSLAAISGDTIAIVADNEGSSATGVNGDGFNNDAPYSGAVYVFVRSGTNWTQQAYLKASNSRMNGTWGRHGLALSGDTLVVSAAGQPLYGRPYVFERNGTNWSEQMILKSSTGESIDIGAISGDTLVCKGSSGAFIFVRQKGAWTEQARIRLSGVGAAISHDTLILGSSDAAYVFVRAGTTWKRQAVLKGSNTEAGDLFGYYVAVSGDIAVVTAYLEKSNARGVNGDQNNNSARESGAAYVFVRNATNWSQQAYLKASNSEAQDLFGVALAASGDTVVVGASREDSSASGVNGNQFNNSARDSGAAYVFAGLGPQPPQLGVERSADSARVFWPLSASSYLLDQTSALASSSAATIWSQVPFPYQTNAINISVTLPISGGNTFYRLRKP